MALLVRVILLFYSISLKSIIHALAFANTITLTSDHRSMTGTFQHGSYYKFFSKYRSTNALSSYLTDIFTFLTLKAPKSLFNTQTA